MIKKYLFMYRKFLSDLKKPKKSYDIADDLHGKELKEYYFLFDEKRVASGEDQKLISRFDENGIPINKTYIDVPDKEFVYFPISIGQMGLAVFHTWLKSGLEMDKERFIKFVEWFYNHAEVTEALGARWLTDVALPQYRNPGSWQSAFSQSRAISILLRGFQLTGNKDYSDMAIEALKPFKLPVAEGGVTSFTQWGPFYEEYTAETPTLVLNGKIFALCGIYDLIRVFPDLTEARQVFDEGINTLINILPEYNLGYWSRYNMCSAEWYPKIDPATIGYQRLHVTQLNMLYKLTGKEAFKEYARIFNSQDTLINALRMYFIKFNSLKKIGRL
ncbi:MAG: hypothetical protein JXR46_14550 [Calditrichaceae bacterium]|nr:hypothetical protein [Calditrichaceae bacterium]MBN2710260.1 hypothetical protein [Calditrichaceae bacterium]